MKESSFYQMIVEEGRAEGVAQGIAQGIAQGKASAEITARRTILMRIATARFGAADPAVKIALEGVSSMERLDELIDRCLQVTSWNELLA